MVHNAPNATLHTPTRHQQRKFLREDGRARYMVSGTTEPTYAMVQSREVALNLTHKPLISFIEQTDTAAKAAGYR